MDIQILREISEEEFRERVDAINSYEILVERSAFSLVNRNYTHMKMMIDTYSSVEKYGGEFHRVDREVMRKSFMAELTNWLAATRLYLENERDFILREFGGASDVMGRYKSATSSAFDAYEGYRFLYNLRDFTQHCGIPPGQFNVSGAGSDRKVEVSLNKSRLLTANFHWSRHAQVLLREWPESISLMPLVDEAMEGYVAVEEEMLRIILERCAKNVPLLLETLTWDETGGYGNASLFRLSREGSGSDALDIVFRTFPAVADMESVVMASRSDDALESIRAKDPTPPPSMSTDGTRAAAVLSAFLAGGGAQQAGDVVNGILQRDGEVSPLIGDLINTSVMLTQMLSQVLGASPHVLLGKLQGAGDE